MACFATVRVPMREADFGLEATKKPNVPGPLPGLPEVTVIQVTLLAPDHVQAAAVETATVPLNPPGAAVIFPRETVYTHAAAWVTVKIEPAMTTVPVRAEAAEFAVTE